MTAGVMTYSMFSPNPVMNPPHGPSVDRPKEYAPPVCGNAGDISAITDLHDGTAHNAGGPNVTDNHGVHLPLVTKVVGDYGTSTSTS